MKQLNTALDIMKMNKANAPKGSIWVHMKTKAAYRIKGHLINEADLEPLVRYQSLENDIEWARHSGAFFDRFVSLIDYLGGDHV